MMTDDLVKILFADHPNGAFERRFNAPVERTLL